MRAHRVDRDGEGGDDAVHGGLLDQQRFPAAGLLHLAIGQFGDLQFRGDRRGDADQFAGTVELLDEVAVGFKGHYLPMVTFWIGDANRLHYLTCKECGTIFRV